METFSQKCYLYLLPLFLFTIIYISCKTESQVKVLVDENFSQISQGPIANDVGAFAEFHYLPEARSFSDWAVSTYRYNLPVSWEIRHEVGDSSLVQTGQNANSYWHPMVITGSEFWSDYTIEVSFSSKNLNSRNGIVFRYQNDQQYYFLGVDNGKLVLLKVNNGIGFRESNEIILAESFFIFNSNDQVDLTIDVQGNKMTVKSRDVEIMSATDNEFENGKIGLLSDSQTSFHYIRVVCDEKAYQNAVTLEKSLKLEQDSLIAQNPKMAVHRKMLLGNFGVGRSVRFGDLDGDGRVDMLFGQVVHHGPKDRNSELSCLTAMTFDGQILWQIGEPDPWKTMVTTDVAFQIHDIDQNGVSEVVYCMNQELIIADGRTGKTIKKISNPHTPGGKALESGHNKFKRILGDCIYFLDLAGDGYASDLILKDRYTHLWAYDKDLKLRWDTECRTGHYPYAYDTDADGKDELLAGYSLIDDDGQVLWSLDKTLYDHADAVAITPFDEGENAKILCTASDEGIFYADLEGNILKQEYIGHVQNPIIANFRDDLPGLESLSINFWGSQGVIHLFDKNGDIYKTFEPNQYGSVCSPLNWTGKSEEFFVLNANSKEGGAWDGYGRKVLEFPDDGHPDMCFAVMDITGDVRDEIVVWDPHEVWIYTQEDNPIYNQELYEPKRNPLYNYSNFQGTVSR
ncbi:rhamnogalacturonan lyase family protein [Sunxiuqinia sp. A32]|uniref:rhamnogalacturonan lyase family protein n=1 Tax=Sunxiuqinia sp. A32 TaxID=3461496 RepID=UPI004045E5AA